MANTLELIDVAKTYNAGRPNALTVFEGLNLNLSPGEVVGLIAPSGTGKSTLLNLAGLLDSPSAGKILIDGLDMTRARDDARTVARRDKIGFVFQFHHLLGEFSALENVMIPLMGAGVARNQARARAEELLGKIGLADRHAHRPATLSGGEAQRVAICRALAAKPKLLLADEPTGNLDPDNAARVFDLFLELARNEGLSALVATHNHELAAKMDRVVDLRHI